MIGYLQGKVIDNFGHAIIVDVSGVGYLVEYTGNVEIGNDEIKLFIHTHVREQEIRLFGFDTRQQLYLFQQLISVSGVGPKAALSIISNYEYSYIVNAIVFNDAASLKSPGVGKKTAERIVLELNSKLKNTSSDEAKMTNLGKSTSQTGDLYAALVELGFAQKEIEVAIQKINTEGSSLNDMIKEALKIIS